MNLSIEIIDKKPKRKNITGQITIGDFFEYFDMSLNYWTIKDYKSQWEEGLKRLEYHNTSCLIVTIEDPACCKFIEWWPIYKIGNKLHIQNHMIINEIYDERIGNKSFTRENCYDFVPEYHSHTEDGTKLSEWVVDWEKSE